MRSPTLFSCLLLSNLQLLACSRDVDPPASRAEPAASRPADATESARLPLARYDCVTRHGLPVMVQITHDGVRPTSRPDGGAPGAPLGWFVPLYYLFEEVHDEDELVAYRIGDGPRHESIVGYVPVDAASRWNSRVAAAPTGAGENEFFAVGRDLLACLRGDEVSPIGRWTGGASDKALLWPVLDVDRVVVAGRERELLRVAFVGAAARASELRDLRERLRVMEVVLVVDDTGSMEPFHDAAVATLGQMAAVIDKAAGATHPVVRWGMVSFRDHERSEYVTSAHAFGDLETLRTTLGSLVPVGGGDSPEAGLDAIDAALDLGFSADPLATRVVILASDAPMHERCPEHADWTIDGMAKRAVAAGVQIYGLSIRTGDDADQLGQYERLCDPTGGAALPLSDADTAVARIRELLGRAGQGIGEHGDVITSFEQGHRTAEAIARKTGLPLERVTEIVTRLDLASGDGPGFATGWLVEEQDGVRLLERRCLMSRSELDAAIGAFSVILTAVRRDARQATGALAGVLPSYADPTAILTAYLGHDDVDLDLALAARGIPVAPDSVLRFPPSRLRQPDESFRRHIEERLDAAIAALTSIRHDDRRWFARDARGDSWATVPVEVLP